MKTPLLAACAIVGLVLGGAAIPAHASDSIYGALYEGGALATTDGLNNDSVLLYHADYPGFISITTNSAGSQWWTSNPTGTAWKESETNPLDGYGCVGVGRHAIATYNGEVYFGAQCTEDSLPAARIFKLTSKDTVELMYTRSAETEEDIQAYYPTAAVVAGNLYMFYNGGFTQYDGATFTEVTDASGQTSSVPLEASSAKDGLVYLPLVNGDVQTFDGTAYTTIGEDFLEGITDETAHQNNLPAAEVFNNTVYVGNQDFDNGATLFEYNASDATWTAAAQLDPGDTIINKMQVSDEVGDSEYLVLYTANAETGSNIYVMDTSNTLTKLVDSGLGTSDPEHNVEVISAIKRTVHYGVVDKKVMLFSTKNFTDQSKIFILNLGTHLAIDALPRRIISTVEEMEGGSASINMHAASTEDNSAETAYGQAFQYKIKKDRVEVGAVYSLWINGERVDTVVGEKDTPILLTYSGAADLDLNDTFDVQVGVRHAYGRRSTRIRAANVIMGETLTVTVK